ncbi:hypothetical protein NVP1115B_47 [Vibrio phage 1.115.B._10N.222.49.B11]|nr:hypothetical protein NVP1115A_47 [Vibrio phage 1.115.A._10N.222.49.B11]AUR88593.1 hypothetical protein NVP1115B_47 [Vibrio phage 1.115.B._10N.222.49.B11]
MKDFLVKNIKDHLVSIGLNPGVASIYADKGYYFYKSEVANSKDAFKEACDHAGKMAENT